jgi:hypothetical protein
MVYLPDPIEHFEQNVGDLIRVVNVCSFYYYF